MQDCEFLLWYQQHVQIPRTKFIDGISFCFCGSHHPKVERPWTKKWNVNAADITLYFPPTEQFPPHAFRHDRPPFQDPSWVRDPPTRQTRDNDFTAVTTANPKFQIPILCVRVKWASPWETRKFQLQIVLARKVGFWPHILNTACWSGDGGLSMVKVWEKFYSSILRS